MAENINVFDFALTGEDMAAISAVDEGESLFFSHYALRWLKCLRDFTDKIGGLI